ncbi:MAG: Heme/hemopexin-binding protein [Candidatus Anoxychlamydiales bacterium]|nr:Heme/hemopexin-binding protein [Candidatus Anoxychlamydiales bacterium]NGX41255.1 Heme/hemopexin-binding protein [Candidatus Anoxychlamydiales bacterium]
MKYIKLLIILPILLFANPQNPQVISGDINFSSSSNHLHIEASDKAIINWDSFSIDQNEITKFSLPSSQAAVLNRVIGQDISKISGLLESNGVIYLINKNGIFIDSGGLINVAGFLASTLDLDNKQFLAGSEIVFTNPNESSVINIGKINAFDGDVIVLAHSIINEGEISAKTGEVNLSAAKKILLMPDNQKKLVIQISEESSSKIDQKGIIKAAEVKLSTDGNPYSAAINNEGWIDALGTEEIDGKVYLVAQEGDIFDTGKITAQNKDETGGDVFLLGKGVRVYEDAEINVSGKKGGGTILLGGDYKGNNPNIFNADKTFVEKNAKIYADCLDDGNGGKIILWSNNATVFYGKISAEGGHTFGDGGFVEISSKGYLEPRGLVTTLAPNGKTGTLLFDPANITISNVGGANSNMNEDGASPTNTVWADPDPGVLLLSTGGGIGGLLNILLPANNIVLDSTAGAAAGIGTITVDADVGTTIGTTVFVLDGTTNNDLTFNAFADIIVNGAISVTSAYTSNLKFTAGDTASVGVSPTIDVNAPIQFAAGSTGNFTMEIDPSNINDGLISIDAPITFNSTGTLTIDASGGASLTTGNVTIADTITLADAASLAISAKNNVTITNLVKYDDTTTPSTSGISVTTTSGDLIVGTGTSSSQLGCNNGTTTLTIAGDLTVLGGNANNEFSQIGFETGTIDGDITINVDGDLLVQGGSFTNCYAAIGHGDGRAGGAGGTRAGDITISGNANTLNSLQLLGGTSSNCFAQIGHIREDTGAITITTARGDISVTEINGQILLQGSVDADQSYAMIGHGGKSTTTADTYRGNVTVAMTSTSSADIKLTAGTFDESFASIGHKAFANAATVTIKDIITPIDIAVTSNNNIVLSANDSSESSIGARVIGTNNGSGDIEIDQMTITTNNSGNVLMNTISTAADFHGNIIGAFSGTGTSLPLTTVGTAKVDNLTLTLGGGLSLDAGLQTGSAQIYNLITNGSGAVTPSAALIVTAASAAITVQGGGGFSSIDSKSALTLTATAGQVSITAPVGTDTNRNASLVGRGNTAITGTNVFLRGINSGPDASITTTSGTLSVSSTSTNIELSDNSFIDHLGTGAPGAVTIDANSTGMGELTIGAGSFIRNQSVANVDVDSGNRISLLAGTAGSASIISNSTLNVNAGENLLLIGSDNGAAQITATDTAVIGARHYILRGGTTLTNNAQISASSGNLTITAADDVLMEHNAKITISAGTGNLIIDINPGTGQDGDLKLLNSADISNAGTGDVTIDVGSNAFIQSGYEGGVTLTTAGATSSLSLIVVEDLRVTATDEGAATIRGAAQTTLSCRNMSLTGTSDTTGAFVRSTGGLLSITTTESLLLDIHGHIILSSGIKPLTITTGTSGSGDLILLDRSIIDNMGTGLTTLTSNSNFSIISGSEGDSRINTLGAIDLNVTGSILIYCAEGGNSFISGAGNIDVACRNIAINGETPSNFSYITTTSGNIEVISQNDVKLFSNSFINNTGSGSVTLVIDQQQPTPPGIGPGRFLLGGDSYINTSGGTVGIFTASPSQNSVQGKINGAELSQNNPLQNQVYNTYFSSYSGALGSPFTIFYKINGVSPNALNLLSFISAEVNQILEEKEFAVLETQFYEFKVPSKHLPIKEFYVPIYNIYPNYKYPLFINKYNVTLPMYD